MAGSDQQQYPWDGPEDDVIADSDDDLDEGPTATMIASDDRTNYVRVQNHALYVDEPEDLNHSFKKGGRGEAPSALGYLMTAAMGCQVNSLEQMLHKARITEYEIGAECTGLTYLEDNIKRVQKMDLEITLKVPKDHKSQAERCLDVYEKGCVVGESIKRGIELDVKRELVLDNSVGE